MTNTLQALVSLYPVVGGNGKPRWTGSVLEYLGQITEPMTSADAALIVRDLENSGRHQLRIGPDKGAVLRLTRIQPEQGQ